jgi:hypothetical protein
MNVRINAMDDMTSDEDKENVLDEIPDDVLETAAGTGNESAIKFTQWICTAVYFCPGP